MLLSPRLFQGGLWVLIGLFVCNAYRHVLLVLTLNTCRSGCHLSDNNHRSWFKTIDLFDILEILLLLSLVLVRKIGRFVTLFENDDLRLNWYRVNVIFVDSCLVHTNGVERLQDSVLIVRLAFDQIVWNCLLPWCCRFSSPFFTRRFFLTLLCWRWLVAFDLAVKSQITRGLQLVLELILFFGGWKDIFDRLIELAIWIIVFMLRRLVMLGWLVLLEDTVRCLFDMDLLVKDLHCGPPF